MGSSFRRGGSLAVAVFVIGALFALLPATVARADEPTGDNTSLVVNSDEGDYIFNGQSHTWYPSDGGFYAWHYSADTTTISFQNPGTNQYVYMQFGAPQGTPLAAGPYENAERSASPTTPGLDVTSQYGGCNQTTGRFDVLEAVYAADGTVERFAADFEQHCEGGEPALHGQIRYHASDTFAPAPDDDADGVANTRDNCPAVANPNQADGDKDRIGDACDPTSETTWLEFVSDPGDYIGGGLAQTWYRTEGAFAADGGTNGLQVRFTGRSGTWWSLTFVAPQGHALVPGPYDNADHWPNQSPANPAFEVSGSGRACNTAAGRFDVRELSVGADGSIERFSADFEQYCDGASAALRGRIRFNSSETFPSIDDDGDGVANSQDNCPQVANPEQADMDVDGAGDVCDDGFEVTWLEIDAGPGTAQTFYRKTSNIVLSRSGNRVSVNVYQGSTFWSLNFAAPDDAPLTPQAYPNAKTENAPGTPFLSVYGSPTYCDPDGGSFDVFGGFVGNSSLDTFAADFVETCANGGTITGRVRFNGPQTVGATTTTLSAPTTADAHSPVTLTATVAPRPGGGTVRFTNGGNAIAGCDAQPADANGTATCTTSFDSGVQSVAAAFSGVRAWKPSASDTVAVTVRMQPTALDVQPATVLPIKRLVQLSARLMTKNGASPVAGRYVKFVSLDGKYLGRARTNASGVATYDVGPLDGVSPYSKGYAALFDGDALYLPSRATGPSALPAP
jgi:hypothetical protein